MSLILSAEQQQALIRNTREWVADLRVPRGSLGNSEVTFTADFLLPKLRSFVLGLLKPDLYVRGDGGPSVQPLVTLGVTIYPDMTVTAHEDRYLAFEVKFLRESDPGGSLTKAIGQSVIYGELGYTHSFGLIFDLRESRFHGDDVTWKQLLLSTGNSEVHIFS